MSALDAWPQRQEARALLLANLRQVEVESDPIVERAGLSQERLSLPRTSRVTPAATPHTNHDIDFEQTLAASTSSSHELAADVTTRPKPRGSLPLVLTMVAVIAFCGGWWLAFKDKLSGRDVTEHAGAQQTGPFAPAATRTDNASKLPGSEAPVTLEQAHGTGPRSSESVPLVSSSFAPNVTKPDAPATPPRVHVTPHTPLPLRPAPPIPQTC